MWLHRKKPIIDRRTIIAFVGGFFAITVIVVLSVLIQKDIFSGRNSDFDKLVPAESTLYMHVDLSARQRNNLKDLKVTGQLDKLLHFAGDELKKYLPIASEINDLFSRISSELAIFQLAPEMTGIIVDVKSIDEFESYLDGIIGANRQLREISGHKIITDLDKKVSWSKIEGRTYALANDIEVINRIISLNKDSRTMADRLVSYRPTAQFIYGLAKPLVYLEKAAHDDLWDNVFDRATGDLEEIFFNLDTDSGLLAGKVSNHPTSLLELISSGDASNIYRRAEKYLPDSYKISWLKSNPADLLEGLNSIFDQAENNNQFNWPEFFKSQLGYNWQENILPVLDLATDVTIAKLDDSSENQTDFLLTFEPDVSASLAEELNNLQAIIRSFIGTLYPKRVEKTLIDGSTIIELLPDPNAGEISPYNYEGREISDLKLYAFPESDKRLVLGVWGERVIFSNSEALTNDILAKTYSRDNVPDCINAVGGDSLLIMDGDYLREVNQLGRYISKIYIGNAGKDNKLLLYYCLDI